MKIAAAIIFALLASGCSLRVGPYVSYADCKPEIGQVCFAESRHIPILESPNRVAVYRPTKDTLLTHFDTSPPSSITQNLGTAGTALQDTSVIRSALGF